MIQASLIKKELLKKAAVVSKSTDEWLNNKVIKEKWILNEKGYFKLTVKTKDIPDFNRLNVLSWLLKNGYMYEFTEDERQLTLIC